MSQTATNGQIPTAGLACMVTASTAGLANETIEFKYDHGSYVTEQIVKRAQEEERRRAITARIPSAAELDLIAIDPPADWLADKDWN